MTWRVGIEKILPHYEYEGLDVFPYKRDALEWAERYAQKQGGVFRTPHCWGLPGGNFLLVWEDVGR